MLTASTCTPVSACDREYLRVWLSSGCTQMETHRASTPTSRRYMHVVNLFDPADRAGRYLAQSGLRAAVGTQRRAKCRAAGWVSEEQVKRRHLEAVRPHGGHGSPESARVLRGALHTRHQRLLTIPALLQAAVAFALDRRAVWLRIVGAI